MNWEVRYLREAEKELDDLDGSTRIFVRKAIKKISINPLPVNEGGYGHPLSNKNGSDLAGFLKVKLKAIGIRIVYKLERRDNEFLIVIIGARADDEVYETASKRIHKYKL